MKKMIGTAVILAALAAPAVAGGLDPVVEATPIMEPVMETAGSSAGSMGSMGSAGGILPVLLVLGLLGAAASSSGT